MTAAARLPDAAPQRGKIPYLDVLRACATYLVVALHCISGYLATAPLFGTRTWWVCNVLNSFVRMGVPIFFMLSGYLLLSDPRTADLKTFYKRRLGKLVVPFLFWDVLYFAVKCIVAGRFLGFEQFFDELFLRGSKYHLWFIYQIIALYLLAPFLKKMVDHARGRELCVLLVIILIVPTFFRLANVVQSVVYVAPFLALMEGYTGFFLLGYLLGTYRLSKKRRWLVYLGGVAGVVIGVAGNYLLSSPEDMNLFFNEGYFINHFLTAGAFFLLVKSISHRLPEVLCRAAGQVSKLSFGIYLSHALALDLFRMGLVRLGVALSPAWYIPASFIFAAVVSTLLAWVLSKLPVLKRVV